MLFPDFRKPTVKSISLPVLLAGTGISFAIGFGIAWSIPAPAYEPVRHAVSGMQTAPVSGAQGAGMNQAAALWNSNTSSLRPASASAATYTLPASSEEEKLRTLASTDPAALRKLIQRFGNERDQQAREMLKSVLANIQHPEVLALSTRLIGSNEAAQRKEGFALLQQFPPNTAEVRKAVKTALATEQSPDVLTQALSTLKPSVVEPAEAETIVAQLRALSRNADPSVRSQSLLQLVQWDKNGAGNENLSEALNDPFPEVRQAALSALAQSGLRSENLKNKLIAMIGNAAENRELRSNALQILGNFGLSKEEYAHYSQARSQIGL